MAQHRFARTPAAGTVCRDVVDVRVRHDAAGPDGHLALPRGFAVQHRAVGDADALDETAVHQLVEGLLDVCSRLLKPLSGEPPRNNALERIGRLRMGSQVREISSAGSTPPAPLVLSAVSVSSASRYGRMSNERARRHYD